MMYVVICSGFNIPKRPDSTPVVFIQEIQRRERWLPRKGAHGEMGREKTKEEVFPIILCSSISRAVACYIKGTEDESAKRQLSN